MKPAPDTEAVVENGPPRSQSKDPGKSGSTPPLSRQVSPEQEHKKHHHFGPAPEAHDKHKTQALSGGLFKEVNELKNLEEPSDRDEREKAAYNDGFFGTLAKDKRFEVTTMFFICFNALAIGYEADYSARFHKPDNLYDKDTPIGFKIVENLFAVYFTAEVVIRFIGYKVKCNLWWDRWFVFDASLVTMMVAETWILPFLGSGGPLAQLSVLRLLRLLRVTRMAKLMRQLPELMLIVKGMAAAVRAVVWTVILLILISFTWAILFTSEYHQGKLPDLDDDVMNDVDAMFSFGSMGKSFFSLIIMGTILDDVTYCADVIRSTGNDMMLVCFVIFIIIASFMMLNMLLGILVEVVENTSNSEKARFRRDRFQEACKSILTEMDQDNDYAVSREEFMAMRENKKVQVALKEMDIDAAHFGRYAELLYQDVENIDDSASLTYEEISNMILRLSPGALVSVLDFNSLSQVVVGRRERFKRRMENLELKVTELVEQRCGITLATAIESPPSSSRIWTPADGERRRLQQMMNTTVSSASSETCNVNPKLQHSMSTSSMPIHAEMFPTFPGFVPEPGAWQQGTDLTSSPAVVSNQAGVGSRSITRQTSAPSTNGRKIGIHTLALMESTGSVHILEELQRRLGVIDLGETGVPLEMLDQELQAKVKSADAYYSLADQQADAIEVQEVGSPVPQGVGIVPVFM